MERAKLAISGESPTQIEDAWSDALFSLTQPDPYEKTALSSELFRFFIQTFCVYEEFKIVFNDAYFACVLRFRKYVHWIKFSTLPTDIPWSIGIATFPISG